MQEKINALRSEILSAMEETETGRALYELKVRFQQELKTVMAGMKDLQCAHVPAELNRKVKALFADYVKNFVNYRKTVTVDNSAPVDFGHYLEGYVD